MVDIRRRANKLQLLVMELGRRSNRQRQKAILERWALPASGETDAFRCDDSKASVAEQEEENAEMEFSWNMSIRESRVVTTEASNEGGE